MFIKHSCSTEQDKKEYSLSKEDTFHVKNEWHQIINPYKEVCKIIEIQYGEKLKKLMWKDYFISMKRKFRNEINFLDF